MRSATGWRVAFAVVLMVHLAALYWPRVDLSGAPQDSDKLAHVLLFGVPVFVGVLAVRRWWPAVLLVVHAPLSESIQAGWLPGRSGSVADAVADLVGVALGSVFAAVVLRRWARSAEGGDPALRLPAAHRRAASRRVPGPEV